MIGTPEYQSACKLLGEMGVPLDNVREDRGDAMLTVGDVVISLFCIGGKPNLYGKVWTVGGIPWANDPIDPVRSAEGLMSRIAKAHKRRKPIF